MGRSPIQAFEKTGIRFERGGKHNELIVHRDPHLGGTLTLTEGGVFHSTMAGVVYNVVVRDVIFSSSNTFQDVKIDLDNAAVTYNGQYVFNVSLFDTFRAYERRLLENCVAFWTTLRLGQMPKTTPSPKTTPKKSPLADDEFHFELDEHDNLLITNTHDVTFTVKPDTYFKSRVTMEEDADQDSKSVNLTKTKLAGRTNVGIVEGKFATFHPHEADVELTGIKEDGVLKRTLNYESELEFWQNLEIITDLDTFPRSALNPAFEIQDKDTLVIRDDTNKPFKIVARQKFSTEIFRSADLRAYLLQRLKFDFTMTSGIPQNIHGHFVKFENNEAVISIDLHAVEMCAMGAAALLPIGMAAAAYYGVAPDTLKTKAYEASATLGKKAYEYGQMTWSNASEFIKSQLASTGADATTIAEAKETMSKLPHWTTLAKTVSDVPRQPQWTTLKMTAQELWDQARDALSAKIQKDSDTIGMYTSKAGNEVAAILQMNNIFKANPGFTKEQVALHVLHKLGPSTRSIFGGANYGVYTSTYRVPLNAALTFWEHLKVPKTSCTIAAEKDASKVRAVRNAAAPPTPSSRRTVTKKTTKKTLTRRAKTPPGPPAPTPGPAPGPGPGPGRAPTPGPTPAPSPAVGMSHYNQMLHGSKHQTSTSSISRLLQGLP
jgi:hypothetical protein